MADALVVNVADGTESARPLTTEEQQARVADEAAADAAVLERANESTIASQLDQALDAMRTHVQRGTFTATQRDNALLLVLRVCIGLVRLTRRRLESAD